MTGPSPIQLLFAIAFSLLYIISLAIYRLVLSPISNIPGPKIAAVTQWFEFYYDIITYGRYIFKLQDLHEKYGPIIRISPSEVHISDPDFYDTLYASTNTNRKDRWSFYTSSLGLPESTLGTIEQGLHRRRRAALAPFFSKQNARKLQPGIEERASALVSKLQTLAANGEVAPINLAFSAFANDVVMQYCFGRNDHRIETQGFDPSFHHTSFSAGISSNLMRNCNWILKFTQALPESISTRMSPEMSSFVILKRERVDQINEIKRSMNDKTKEISRDNIFHGLLTGDLPASEKGTIRLADEAILLVGAGTHTTAWAMSIAAFHLINDPIILKKLKAELEEAIPNPSSIIPLPTLEQLPYLTAVIKEGLRLSYGNTSRIPRIALDQPIRYKDYIIPVGVPVSMAVPDIHLNESIFPDAKRFLPERWTEDSTGHLDRYLCSFIKGPRACIGMNLAWAEMYICLSKIFRTFGAPGVHGASDLGIMELFETDLGDVEMSRDALFMMPKDGSKGVRMKLSK